MNELGQKLSQLQLEILDAVDHKKSPMFTIYSICRVLNQPQHSSQSRFYVRVYRACEKLVEMKLVWVARGTRDPSVYLAKKSVKGFDSNGIQDIPF